MSGPASAVFKSICEEVLLPAGVKVGGYPDELFKDLPEAKRQSLECQICYLVAKDALRCGNGHLFCSPCIYAWSLTSDDNADRCPVCRRRGCYRHDASAAGELAVLSVACPEAGCAWSGQLLALRSHDHGAAVAGADARRAGLPFVRSRSGDVVFPDFGHGPDGFRATAEMERLRRRQRLARIHGHVLDGQARLAFLMSLFEEDLERRRGNLAAIANMQRRFHDQQFDQLIQLEQELGAITARLIQLVESATGSADRLNRTLTGGSVARVRSTSPDVATGSDLPSNGRVLPPALPPLPPLPPLRPVLLHSPVSPELTPLSNVLTRNGASVTSPSTTAVVSVAATTAAAAAAAAAAASALGLGGGSSGAERRAQQQQLANLPEPADESGTGARLLARRDVLANRLHSSVSNSSSSGSGTSNAVRNADDAAATGGGAAAPVAQRRPMIVTAGEAMPASTIPSPLSTGSIGGSRQVASPDVIRASNGGAGEGVPRAEASASNRAGIVSARNDGQSAHSSSHAALQVAAAGTELLRQTTPHRSQLPVAAAGTTSENGVIGNYNPHIITYPPNRLQVVSRAGSIGATPSAASSSSAAEAASAASNERRLMCSPSTAGEPGLRLLQQQQHQHQQQQRTDANPVSTLRSSPRRPINCTTPPLPRSPVISDSILSTGGTPQPNRRQQDGETLTRATALSKVAASSAAVAASASAPSSAVSVAAAVTASQAIATPRELSSPQRLHLSPAASTAVSGSSEAGRENNTRTIANPPKRIALLSWRSPTTSATSATMRNRGRRSTTPDIESGRIPSQFPSPQRPAPAGSGATASTALSSAATIVRSPPMPGGTSKSIPPRGNGEAGRSVQPNSVARNYCYL